MAGEGVAEFRSGPLSSLLMSSFPRKLAIRPPMVVGWLMLIFLVGVDVANLSPHGNTEVRECAFNGGVPRWRPLASDKSQMLRVSLLLQLRGGERDREQDGKVGKRESKTKNASKREKRKQLKGASNSTREGESITIETAADLRAGTSAGGGETADATKVAGGEELQTMVDDQAAEHAQTEDVTKLDFEGDFGTDFPNRRRIDEIYQDTVVHTQEDGESSELEVSSDDVEDNPFEVCVTAARIFPLACSNAHCFSHPLPALATHTPHKRPSVTTRCSTTHASQWRMRPWRRTYSR